MGNCCNDNKDRLDTEEQPRYQMKGSSKVSMSSNMNDLGQAVNKDKAPKSEEELDFENYSNDLSSLKNPEDEDPDNLLKDRREGLEDTFSPRTLVPASQNGSIADSNISDTTPVGVGTTSSQKYPKLIFDKNLKPTDKLNTPKESVRIFLDSNLPESASRHSALKSNFPGMEWEEKKRLKDTATGITYEGNVKGGLPEGWGKCILKDGGVVEGFFKGGKPMYWSRYLQANGTIYEGEILDFSPHGKGTLAHPKGQTIKSHNWVHGQVQGPCTIYFKGSQKKLFFEGQLLDGKKNGQCTFYEEKSKSYLSGNFENDLLQGKGKRVKDSGEVIEAVFKNGLENGPGNIAFPDGREWSGPFENGQAEGQGQFTTDYGQKLPLGFKHGQRQR